MKHVILGLLLLTSPICFSQDKDCQRFKDGDFLIKSKKAGSIYLKRKGEIQIEEVKRDKVKLKFKVAWLDDCTYTLTLIEVIKNPINIPIDKNMIVTVRIIETKPNSYIQKSTAYQGEIEHESEVFILK